MSNLSKSSHRFSIFLIIGLTGSLGGVLADIFTAYSPNQSSNMASVFSGMASSIKNLLIDKSHSDLVTGHYLAIISIPFGIFGVWYISKMFKNKYRAWGKVVFLLSAVVYAIGTTFHGIIGMVATVFKYGNDNLSLLIIDFFEPLVILTMGSLIFLLAALAFFIAFGFTNYPRWIAFLSPLSLQVILSLLAGFTPPPIGNLFLVTGLNLSMMFFFLVSLVGHTAKWWQPRKILRENEFRIS